MEDTPQGLDLASLDPRAGANAGFDVHLKHPDSGEPIGAVIRVHGEDSERYREKILANQRKHQEQIFRKGARGMPGPETIDQNVIALLAAVTSAWSGVIIGGQAVPFSVAAAEQLYRDYAWIREQIEEAVKTRANFLPRSAIG